MKKLLMTTTTTAALLLAACSTTDPIFDAKAYDNDVLIALVGNGDDLKDVVYGQVNFTNISTQTVKIRGYTINGSPKCTRSSPPFKVGFGVTFYINNFCPAKIVWVEIDTTDMGTITYRFK